VRARPRRNTALGWRLVSMLQSDDKRGTRWADREWIGRRPGTELVMVLRYLASPASSWVTGKTFDIDAGVIASNWPIKIPLGL
jgi:NAD(P)-dependent dehydrogenase (short-subunit alcohol dehydrogenase family)